MNNDDFCEVFFRDLQAVLDSGVSDGIFTRVGLIYTSKNGDTITLSKDRTIPTLDIEIPDSLKQKLKEKVSVH